jgi:hypothetical protein
VRLMATVRPPKIKVEDAELLLIMMKRFFRMPHRLLAGPSLSVCSDVYARPSMELCMLV